MNMHLERAQLLMSQRRYDLAEEQLRLAMFETERRGPVHGLLALCLLEREAFDEAQQEAEQAIHEAPDEAFGFYALTRVFMERRRLPEAERTIREAIGIDPTDPDYFGTLAAICQQQYRWDECLAAADEGLRWDPDHAACVNMRAIALVKLGRREEAGQSIDSALQRNPDDAITHANQGWTLLHQGEPRKAMEHFREALRLEPNLEWARLGIVESMKARNFIYRWMLAFFLKLNRFPPKVQLALMLGLMFGQQIIVRVFDAVPALKPFSGFVIAAYIIFVWMTWTSSTLFNLVLRLDRFGRLVLSESEKRASTFAGLCIVSCLALGIAGSLIAKFPPSFWLTGALFLGLMLPVSQCFQENRNKQLIAAAYSLGLLAIIGMAIWRLVDLELFIVEAEGQLRNAKDLAEAKEIVDVRMGLWMTWWRYGLNGIVLWSWLGSGMSALPEGKR